MSILGNVSIGGAAATSVSTQPTADSSTNVSTTAFVHNVVNSAIPGGAITTQTNTDSSTNIATTAFVHNVVNSVIPGGAITTQPVSDNSTNVATTAFVHNVLSSGAGAGISIPFSGITGTPTTLAGYGITDGGASGYALIWSVHNADFTAVANTGIIADTSLNPVTVTLPANPSVGMYIEFTDYAGTFATHNLIIAPGASLLLGASSNLVVNINNTSLCVIYSSSTRGWIVDSAANVFTNTTVVNASSTAKAFFFGA